MKKKTRRSREASHVSSLSLRIAAAVCGVIVLAHLVAGFFPEQRVWGINNFAYFPLAVGIALTALTLSVFIPAVNRRLRMMVMNPLTSLYERISRGKPYLWYAGFSLLAMALFWVLRSRTYFWGDGLGLVTALNEGGLIRGWAEFLEVSLHINLHRFLGLFLSAHGQLTYQVASIAAGGIFVFFAFLFSDYLGRDPFEKFFVLSILLTMGSTQLFFGSAEHYSFAYLSIFVYLFLSLRWIDRGGSILLVVLSFALALGFHFASFYLLPSLAYLLLAKRGSRLNRKLTWGLELGLVLAGILFLWHVFESKPGLIRIFVLPVEQRFAPGYTWFSWTHLLDLLNEHLLISPVGLALVSAAIAIGLGKTDLRGLAVRFLLLVTAFQLLFHFVIDPGLGAPRDWDLFSPLSLGYTVLGLRLLLNLGRGQANFKYLATILVAVSAYSTLPWIALNASEDRSIQKYRDVLDLDPKRSRSGHFLLARYFSERGMVEEAERENRKQRETFPEVVLLEEGIEHFNQGRLAEARNAFQRAIQQDPAFPDVHFFLAKTYLRQGALQAAEEEYRKTVELMPEFHKAHIDLAKIYASRKEWKDAIRHYEKILKLDVKDPVVYTDLGKIYALRGEYEKATKYLEKAIEINEDYVDAHSVLGEVWFALNRLDEAAAECRKVIELQPDSESAHLFLAEIYSKQGSRESAIRILEQFLRASSDSTEIEKVREILTSLRSQE